MFLFRSKQKSTPSTPKSPVAPVNGYDVTPATSPQQPRPKPSPPIPSDPWRKKILIMGLRRAGKTAVRQVVFHRLGSKQALFVDTTTSVQKEDIDGFFLPLQVWEIPGSMSIDALEPTGVSLAHFSTLIFVIDAADDYGEALKALNKTFATAVSENPSLHFEIFAHKADVWDEFFRGDAYRQIMDRTISELEDHQDPAVQSLVPEFHLTSIFDNTIFDAFSKVVQRLMPRLGFLEQTLNYWSGTLDVGKCFLIDVHTRLYIATDASPVDTASHALCCHYINNLEKFSDLFKALNRRNKKGEPVQLRASGWSRLSDQNTVAYWQVTERLALVALCRTATFDAHRGGVEMNVRSFSDAIRKVVALETRQVEKLEARRRQLLPLDEPKTSAV